MKRTLVAPLITRQFLRYGITGAMGTVLHFATLVVLVQFGQVNAVGASTSGAIAGALANYLLNYRYTFASKQAHAQALPRFAIVALAGMAVNAAIMATMLNLAWHYLVAQAFSTTVVLIAGYLANRKWTF
jgi:putative flippase GtrA